MLPSCFKFSANPANPLLQLLDPFFLGRDLRFQVLFFLLDCLGPCLQRLHLRQDFFVESGRSSFFQPLKTFLNLGILRFRHPVSFGSILLSHGLPRHPFQPGFLDPKHFQTRSISRISSWPCSTDCRISSNRALSGV